jgi:hypothetical protein
MNRLAMGALCATACLLSAVRAKRIRGALGAYALEQMEHMFNFAEKHVRLSKPTI